MTTLRWAAFFTLIVGVLASNWAQTTGVQMQTTTIPYIPSKQLPHWSARMGHAVAVSNVSDDGEKIFEADSYVFLIGGDDYNCRADEQDQFDQYNTVHGLKNDVWRLKAPDRETWYIKADATDRTFYDHEFPEQHSTLRWELVSEGHIPDVGQTYEDFIQCEEFYPQPQRTRECRDSEGSWFSQRRNHQVAMYGRKLFVIGGRAREHMELPQDRAVGGIIGPRPLQEAYSTWRETSVLKNDIWVSEDLGSSWKLIQAGCKSNQFELLLENPRFSTATSEQLAPMFNPALQCKHDGDCYGNQESCRQGVCVCDIWSPREQHRVAVFGGYMYLVGGFASSHQSYCAGMACGDLDASGYREYMNDVWFTDLSGGEDTAGSSWQALTTGADFDGRGGHALAIMRVLYGPLSASTSFALYVIGGETGDTIDRTKSRLMNDVWFTLLPGRDEDPVAIMQQTGWTRQFSNADWTPRTGHVAIVDPPSANNGLTQRVYVVGGRGGDGELKGDVWSWGWECRPNNQGQRYVDGECTEEIGGGSLFNETRWREDYTSQALFRMDSGSRFLYDEGQPQQHYLSPDSEIEKLVKVYLPLGYNGRSYADGYPLPFTTDQRSYGIIPRREQLIDAQQLGMLHAVGIRTVRDLAEASRYDIIKLRGYPKLEEEFPFAYEDVCDHRALAQALIDKCTVDRTLNELTHYDQEKDMPWNVEPEFKGAQPVGRNKNYWKARWHGKYFNTSEPEDDEEIRNNWDGCTHISMNPVNVPGIGDVPLPKKIRNPYREVQELVCRANPGPRAYHAGVYFDQKIYVMGGLVDAHKMASVADMWYRDDYMPRARIAKKPRTLDFGKDPFNIFSQPEDVFIVKADKEGTILEHLLLDADEHKVIRTWDKTRRRVSIRWLDFWYKQGPGSGRYTFYVRSVDPAGNIDISYSRRNMYKWKYVTALPWHIIGGTTGGFIGLCILVWLEHKRRKRKAAMERYAIKRMRRKFKRAQRDLAGRGAIDWKKQLKKDKKKDKGKKKLPKGLKSKDKEKGKASRGRDKERMRLKMLEKEKMKAKHE